MRPGNEHKDDMVPELCAMIKTSNCMINTRKVGAKFSDACIDQKTLQTINHGSSRCFNMVTGVPVRIHFSCANLRIPLFGYYHGSLQMTRHSGALGSAHGLCGQESGA